MRRNSSTLRPTRARGTLSRSGHASSTSPSPLAAQDGRVAERAEAVEENVERAAGARLQRAGEHHAAALHGARAHVEDLVDPAAQDLLDDEQVVGRWRARRRTASRRPEAHAVRLPQGQTSHRRAHGGETTLEVHDPQHGLERRGQDRLAGAAARLVLPSPEPEQGAQLQLRRPAREIRRRPRPPRGAGSARRRRRRARRRAGTPRPPGPARRRRGRPAPRDAARADARWRRRRGSGPVRGAAPSRKRCPRRSSSAATRERDPPSRGTCERPAWRWCRRSRRRWTGRRRRPACAPGWARSRGRSRDRGSRS